MPHQLGQHTQGQQGRLHQRRLRQQGAVLHAPARRCGGGDGRVAQGVLQGVGQGLATAGQVGQRQADARLGMRGVPLRGPVRHRAQLVGRVLGGVPGGGGRGVGMRQHQRVHGHALGRQCRLEGARERRGGRGVILGQAVGPDHPGRSAPGTGRRLRQGLHHGPVAPRRADPALALAALHKALLPALELAGFLGHLIGQLQLPEHTKRIGLRGTARQGGQVKHPGGLVAQRLADHTLPQQALLQGRQHLRVGPGQVQAQRQVLGGMRQPQWQQADVDGRPARAALAPLRTGMRLAHRAHQAVPIAQDQVIGLQIAQGQVAHAGTVADGRLAS